jgi:hypothetical protein
MDKNNSTQNPPIDEKVCFNCKHMLWMVGVGQGVKCGIDKKDIPSRWHTCDKFENKHIDPDFMYNWIRKHSGKP